VKRPLDMALALAEEGERDPVAAVRNTAKLRALLRRAQQGEGASAAPGDAAGLAHVLDRIERVLEAAARPLAALGATHIVRVEDVPTLAPGQATGALKIEWPGGDGVARSLFAGTLDGARASLSSISVRIAINGSEDLFTTGQAPAFVPLVAFQAGNLNWFRLKDYAVSPAQKWTVYFQNEGRAGGDPVTPFLLFGFVQGRRHG
jgi:hypothetical protein